MLESLKSFATECNLLQVVDFNTWSRTINGIKKESLLDHAYIDNLETFDSIYHENPIFGDHLLVIVKLTIKNLHAPNDPLMRNWSRYTTIASGTPNLRGMSPSRVRQLVVLLVFSLNLLT